MEKRAGYRRSRNPAEEGTNCHRRLFQHAAESQSNPHRQLSPHNDGIAKGERLGKDDFNACHQHDPSEEEARPSQHRRRHCGQQRCKLGNQPRSDDQKAAGHHHGCR